MMIDTLKALCSLGGVSGDEGEVRGYITELAGRYADDVTVDVMGNVTAFKKGAAAPAQKLMLCAHMDEVGVLIMSCMDDGCLRFAAAGGIDSRVLVGKAVLIGRERVRGVIGSKAVHLVKTKDRHKTIEIEDLYIDIGAKNREEAETLVSPGDTGVFDTEPREFGGGYIMAKALDDRFGCAVLTELLASELPYDCSFVFTVQEEVGLRGAFAAAYNVKPDIALIIDGTTAVDFPSVPKEKQVCSLGGGVVIPFMDGGTIYDRELFKTLTRLAGDNGIPWQTKTMIAGGTDAAVIQRSRGGVKTAGIAAPLRNCHSPSCVGKISDMEAAFKLAGLFIKEAGAGGA